MSVFGLNWQFNWVARYGPVALAPRERDRLLALSLWQETRDVPLASPWEVHAATRRGRLSRRFIPHQHGLPWRDGRVSFVRLTDQARTTRFFSEQFVVDPTLVHEYITGTIYTRMGLLRFTHQGCVVKFHPYLVTKKGKRV